MKIDLACGTEKPDGYYGIDISPESNADEIHDLKKGIPISSNTVDEVRCHSFLEHLTNTQFIDMMWEIHRVLKEDGKCDFVVPHGLSESGIKDPTHRMHFANQTFSYFESGCLRQKQYKLPPFKNINTVRKGDILFVSMNKAKI